MELRTVKIGGKDRPIKFGTNQSAHYCQIRSIDLPEMQSELSNLATSDGSSIRDLLYSALWAGCKSEKIEVDFDRYDLGDWIDEMDQKEMDKAFQFLVDSEPKADEGGGGRRWKKVDKSTFDDVLKFAFGELNLTPDVFWSLTWKEYYYMVRGWNLKQERESKNLASVLAAVYNTIPKGRGGKTYEADDFLGKPDKPELTLEERQAKAKEAQEKLKRFNKGVKITEV